MPGSANQRGANMVCAIGPIQINAEGRLPAHGFAVAPTTMKRKKCSQCWVHARTEWSVLSAAGVEKIDAARCAVQYRPGESIFHQHDQPQGVYCIEKGHLLLRHFDTFGGQTNFQIVKYGETLGWRSFFAERPHAATAIALTR